MPEVYIATNKVTGDKYIGMTSRSLDVRRKEHESASAAGRHGCTVLNRALKKYGCENFNWERIARFAKLEAAGAMEVWLIKLFRPAYNISVGGLNPFHGAPRTEEWKRNISKAKKGRPCSEDEMARLRNIERPTKSAICLQDGRFFQRLKSAAEFYSIGINRVSVICAGKEISAKGLSFRRSDRPWTSEECAAELARDEERRAERWERTGAAHRRQVICLTTGQIYASATEAAKEIGATQSGISHICAGKVLETKDGLRFRYLLSDGTLEVVPEKVRKLDPKRRAVLCETDDVVFPSLHAAARSYGITPQNLHRALTRKLHHRPAGRKFSFIQSNEAE